MKCGLIRRHIRCCRQAYSFESNCRFRPFSHTADNGLHICIELSFLSKERENYSLWKQMELSYASVRRAPQPIRLHFTSLGSEQSIHYLGLTRKGFLKWDIERQFGTPTQAMFPNKELIMLSPDAKEVIDDIDNDKVYIIGGMADCTVRKNRTFYRAEALGIRAMRFPIQELIPDRQTHILPVNHCVNIITTYLQVKDWKLALETCMPARNRTPK
jgi:tRNA (guanine9-N1)-methyltransferase